MRRVYLPLIVLTNLLGIAAAEASEFFEADYKAALNRAKITRRPIMAEITEKG